MEAPEEATPAVTEAGATGEGAAATATTVAATTGKETAASAPQKSVPYLDVIPLLYIKNHSRG